MTYNPDRDPAHIEGLAATITVISRAKLPGALVAALALAACHGSSSSGGGPPPAPTPVRATYGAKLTGIEITRPADGLDMTVSGLPADGAVLTIQ